MNTDQMFDVPVQDALWRHATALDADGLELHYVRWGQGTPQVLLLHGWPGFWYDWRRVFPRLAQFTSVIAMDLRGFGFSAKPDWPVHSAYSPEAQAKNVLTLLYQLNVESIVLGGYVPTCLGYSSCLTLVTSCLLKHLKQSWRLFVRFSNTWPDSLLFEHIR